MVSRRADFGDRDAWAAREVVEIHAQRWGIELVPICKRWWGVAEFVAAVEGGAGIVDADPLYGVCLDAIARLEAVGAPFL